MIGHIKQSKYFKNLIENGSLGHAYLFTGPEMIGKRSFALDIYRLMNGREVIGDPDFISVAPNLEEDESKISIKHIRKLKSFFSLKPYVGPFKFALINDAHDLTSEASNALLKVLEEPPKFSVLILVSFLPGLLPATIRSRCETVKFNEISRDLVETYLSNKKVNKNDSEFILKLAGGRIGLIKKLVENKELVNARKAVEDLRKLFNAPIYERMNYAKKVHDGGDYQPRVDYWLSWVSAHVGTASRNEKIVKNLLYLHSIVSQPQYNHRLALENFLLNL